MIRAKYITIVVLIVAVVYLVATRDLSKGPAEVSRSSDASIAVLPFVVMATGDERIESLVAEFHNALQSELQKIPNLGVTLATVSSVMEGESLDAHPAVGRIGVNLILEGSLQLTNDRVRVWAQLIDRDTHLWVKSYDRSVDGLGTIPREIAREIAGKIG